MARTLTLGVGASVLDFEPSFPAPPGTGGVLPFWIQDTADTTNIYAAIGYSGGWSPSLDAVNTRIPITITITSWAVRLSSALSGTETLTIRFVLNGTPDVTLPLNFVSGDSVKRANGSLSVLLNDIVAIEAVFGGGLTSKLVRGGTLAYTPQ